MLSFDKTEWHVMKRAVSRHFAEIILESEGKYEEALVHKVLAMFERGINLGFVPKGKKGHEILKIFVFLIELDLRHLTKKDALFCGCRVGAHMKILRATKKKISKAMSMQ